jgi:HAD superfamily hydrolase (TIGR01509 family)
VLGELGWELTQDDVVQRWVGRTDAAMRAEVEEHLGRPVAEEWKEHSARYDEAFAAELQPVDGIEAALDAIQLPTCVASSGTPASIETKLRLTGLWDRFEGRITSAADVEHGKPAPDLFLLAAERMGSEPSSAVVVEDSPFGIEAAHAAGMAVFAYAGGLMPTDRLRGADLVFDDMRDLPRLLAGGNLPRR